ncbi:MAG: hypothetical protein RIE73_27700 [Coleofasciculus sp. C1-SOL-03]|uniref:hypothetical protein n=1 Tax=Coleofasciculus sp. C1-SOL-03 TaxID=3069522 RepID=UPI00330151E3
MDAKNVLKSYPEKARIFPEVYPSHTNLEQVTSKRSQLYTDEWTPLPNWGTFFIELGRRVAEWETGSNRLVVALAIPTRAYAAALTAFGVVVTRATLSNSQIEDTNKYFERLCNLSQGTPVTFFNKGRKFKGFYEGLDKSRGQRRLRIRVESRKTGGLTYLVPLEEAHKIEIRTSPIRNLPKKQNGRKIFAHSKFLEDILGVEKAKTCFNESQLDCIILGKRNLLNKEIKQTNFALNPSFKKIGVLQDVLRVRHFFSTDNPAYRSEVFSVTARKRPSLSDSKIPFVTIFDGASSFIKCRDDWRSSHWIILLDRTEIHFQEAVDIVNQDYINRVDEEEIPNLPSRPPGVELVNYQEAD